MAIKLSWFFLRPLILLTLLSLATLTLGCADKNADDFRQSYAMQKAAKNEAVAGIYRGSLLAVKDQSYRGELELTVTSDLRPVPSQNGLGTEMQAVLDAHVVLMGSHTSIPKEFRNCQFEITSGSFSCLDTANILKIKGTLQGSTLSGKIEVENEALYGGQFTLVENAPALPLSVIQERLKSADLSVPTSQVYQGQVTFLDDGTQAWFSLVVILPEATTDQSFNNLFLASKTVDATLSGPHGTRVVFPNSNFHDGVGSLQGVSSPVADGARMHLNCKKNLNQAFVCDYFTDANAAVFSQVVFTPKEKTLNPDSMQPKASR